MENPSYYLAHDPVGNCEWQVAEFDSDLLARCESEGIIFIAVDKDGNRERVNAGDIKEPETAPGNLVLVQPVYVDDRMKAVVDVFDALAAALMPSVATISDGEQQKDPVEAFAAALAALKLLAYPNEAGEGDEQ